MRPVLRFRQLALQKTWCRPAQPRRSAATLPPQLLDAETYPDPLSSTEGASEQNNADSSSSTAGPSRLPFDSNTEALTTRPSAGKTRIARTSPPNTVEAGGIEFTFEDAQLNLRRLEGHLKSKNHSKTPYTSSRRAYRTWQLYEGLTPSMRSSLPSHVYSAVLRQLIPSIHEIDPWPTRPLAQQRFRREWASRLNAVVSDIGNSPEGLLYHDAQIAMDRSASMGDIDGVERLHTLFTSRNKDLSPDQNNALALARLDALLAWFDGLMSAPSHAPFRDEVYFNRAAQRDRLHEVKADKGVPEREQLAGPKADLVLGIVWSVLMDFIKGRAKPNAHSINAVIMALDRTREVFHKRHAALTLDTMMERVFSVAYGVDTTFLRMHGAVPDRASSLKGIHKDAAMSLLRWLFRRNELWRAIALLELLDSGHWHKVIENELAKVEPAPVPVEPVNQPDDSDIGPTLAEATAAFNEESKSVDMFGRAKDNTFESTALTASLPTQSDLATPVSVEPLPFRNGRMLYARTYDDFYPSNILMPADVPYAELAERANTGVSDFRKNPFTTTYRNTDSLTYRTAIRHAREVNDLTAVIHLTRTYISAAGWQQTYWLQRVFMEQRRLELSKEWRAAQEAKYQRMLEERRERYETRRADFIANAREDNPKLSEEELEDAARLFVRDRKPIERPPSETSWPDSLRPPAIVFSFTMLRIIKAAVKHLPKSHFELQEVNRILSEVIQRVYEEHLVLSGREPTLQLLSDDDYALHMRQDGADVIDPKAPMAAYFDLPPSGLPSQRHNIGEHPKRDAFNPLAYLARLSRTHAALVALLDQSLEERAQGVARRKLRRAKLLERMAERDAMLARMTEREKLIGADDAASKVGAQAETPEAREWFDETGKVENGQPGV